MVSSCRHGIRTPVWSTGRDGGWTAHVWHGPVGSAGKVFASPGWSAHAVSAARQHCQSPPGSNAEKLKLNTARFSSRVLQITSTLSVKLTFSPTGQVDD